MIPRWGRRALRMYFMSLPVKRHFTRNRRSQNLFPPEKPHTSLAVVHSMSSFTISTNHTIVASWSRPAAKSAEGRPSLVISFRPNAYHNNGSICIRSGGNLARASQIHQCNKSRLSKILISLRSHTWPKPLGFRGLCSELL